MDIAVQINDSSVVQVVGRSKAGSERLHRYTSTVVRDVIKTTTQLSPKLEATSYIIHPYTPTMWEDLKALHPDSMYPVSSIVRCIRSGVDYVLSRKQADHLPKQTSLPELFGGWCPSVSVVQDMDFKRKPQNGECVLRLQYWWARGSSFTFTISLLYQYLCCRLVGIAPVIAFLLVVV